MILPIDYEADLATVWQLLHAAREDLIPEGENEYDAQWEEVCLAMANLRAIAEDLEATVKEKTDAPKVLREKPLVKFSMTVTIPPYAGTDTDAAEREVARLLTLTSNRVKEGYHTGILGDRNGADTVSWVMTRKGEDY